MGIKIVSPSRTLIFWVKSSKLSTFRRSTFVLILPPPSVKLFFLVINISFRLASAVIPLLCLITSINVGKTIDMFFCDNQPVAKQFAIGQKLGVNGTPSIFLSDGSFFPGYLSPEDLLKELQS